MKERVICPFGEVLVKARAERGISQYRLAKLVDRNPRYIGQLEHNRREPKLSTVIMLAKALDMDVGELVREVDALTPSLPDEVMQERAMPKKAGRPKKICD